MENQMIYVPLNRYEELCKIQARVEALETVTNRSKYSVDRDAIANILGFELKEKDD